MRFGNGVVVADRVDEGRSHEHECWCLKHVMGVGSVLIPANSYKRVIATTAFVQCIANSQLLESGLFVQRLVAILRYLKQGRGASSSKVLTVVESALGSMSQKHAV